MRVLCTTVSSAEEPGRAVQSACCLPQANVGTESSQIAPESPPTSLLLCRSSAGRWAGGSSSSSSSDGRFMGLCAVSGELLPAVAGLLPVSAPLIAARQRPRQAGPIGSSCRPRTGRQRRVSPAPLRQAKYSVLPWPTAGQERRRGAAAAVQTLSCTEQEMGSHSPQGRARQASSSPQAPIPKLAGF